jgi:hypothetical protein
MGVFSRRYADPSKYASRGSTLSALTVNECVDSSVEMTHKHTARGKRNEKSQKRRKYFHDTFLFIFSPNVKVKVKAAFSTFNAHQQPSSFHIFVFFFSLLWSKHVGFSLQ